MCHPPHPVATHPHITGGMLPAGPASKQDTRGADMTGDRIGDEGKGRKLRAAVVMAAVARW